MADKWVDDTATGSNDGSSPADAWTSISSAASVSAGDTVWIRRTHSESLSSRFYPVGDSNTNNWKNYIGWPRNSHSISSSDWTNGSTSVTIDDNNMARQKHEGRFIDAPDGETYFITKVVSSSSITIDREYAGSTVTNQSATIQKDPDYDNRPSAGQTAGWDSDADTIPYLDFGGNDAGLYLNSLDCCRFANLEVKNTSASVNVSALIDTKYSTVIFEGFFITQGDYNTVLLYIVDNSTVYGNRIIVTGSGTTRSSQIGVAVSRGGGIYVDNMCVKKCGDAGISLYGPIYCELNNVNVGVEDANQSNDFEASLAVVANIQDIKLGGTNGSFSWTNKGMPTGAVHMENYQKVLGEHRTFLPLGYYKKAAVSGETPNKKLSDYVLKLVPNVSTYEQEYSDYYYKIIEHEYEVASSGSKTFKYWIYNDLGVTLNSSTAKDDVFLEIEYVVSYDDTSEYVIAKEYSTQTSIADAADADDWDYLQATVTVDQANTKVRCRIFFNKYVASGSFFVDPQVVIS